MLSRPCCQLHRLDRLARQPKYTILVAHRRRLAVCLLNEMENGVLESLMPNMAQMRSRKQLSRSIAVGLLAEI